MIVGIGTDIVEIARIAKVLERRGDAFARRILTTAEYAQYLQKKDKDRFLAKRYAAKEAVVKALGTGFRQGVSWQHIEISNNSLGQPSFHLQKRAHELSQQKNIYEHHLSLSDEREYVVAFVVMTTA